MYLFIHNFIYNFISIFLFYPQVVFALVGMATYTIKAEEEMPPGPKIGYSFFLGWIATLITLMFTVTCFIYLKKRTDGGAITPA